MHKVSSLFRSKDEAEAAPPPPYSPGSIESPQQSNSGADAKVDIKPNQHQQSPNFAAPNDSKPIPHQPDEIVTMLIGPNHKIYRVSKRQICKESRWIRNQLRPVEQSAVEEDNTITMDQQNPRIWDMIELWLNTKQIADDFYDYGMYEGQYSYPGHIALFYEAAWRMQMPGLMNDIMDATRHLWHTKTWGVMPTGVWNLKSQGMMDTELCRFYLDMMVWDLMKCPKFWLVEEQSKIHNLETMYKNHELTVLVTRHILRFTMEPWEDPRRGSRCAYHDHSDGCKNFATAKQSEKC